MIWTPDTKPPLLSKEAEVKLLARIHEESLVHVAAIGFDTIQESHSPLAKLLNELGSDLGQYAPGANWPNRALKIGASVAILAYAETGFYQEIDEAAVATGALFADLEGVPEAYVASTIRDPLLYDLTRQISRMDGVTDNNEGGFGQIIDMGAGCVRHCIQQAIAA